MTKINLKDVKKQPKKVVLSIRITKDDYRWLKKKDISPTRLFRKVLEVLRYDKD